ncbi:protein kinase family protein [Bacillus sp. DJP31]|uniref:protein kinase family protein n=1 Tax=Bacillus sp. DJP31 TaxID=3409789 RepID=UPI003BB54F3F
MKSYAELAASVIISQKGNDTVLLHQDSSLSLVGTGRSAFVFRIQSTNYALKVFFPSFKHIALEEAEIYRGLKGISYFPELYGVGENFIVIDFIQGDTLFECLRKGIRVSKHHIEEIDLALQLARERGFNPSDIHLRNLLVTTQNEIMIIDVARFRQTKNCQQWSDIKTVYHKFYLSPFFPKKIPSFILNKMASLYKKHLLQRWFNQVNLAGK